jgi:hypothetical protein
LACWILTLKSKNIFQKHFGFFSLKDMIALKLEGLMKMREKKERKTDLKKKKEKVSQGQWPFFLGVNKI